MQESLSIRLLLIALMAAWLSSSGCASHNPSSKMDEAAFLDVPLDSKPSDSTTKDRSDGTC